MTDAAPDTRRRSGGRHGTSLPDLAGLGVTYRQLDYWTTNGYLHVEDDPNPGRGFARTWPAEELAVASRMARLSRAGLSLAAAHQVARGSGDLGYGVTVTIAPPPDPGGTHAG